MPCPSSARRAPSARGTGARHRPGLRTALATVCISGTLEDKLAAAAAAGLRRRGDLRTRLRGLAAGRAAEVRARCADLGLSIDLYQPFRDFDAARPEALDGEPAPRRAQVRRHGAAGHRPGPGLLVGLAGRRRRRRPASPSSCTGWPSRAAERGLRISYEALAWGRYVNTYERSWEIVRRADHPALGLCVDSFHILSRGSDPAGIRDIPGEKLFFLQLADAPHDGHGRPAVEPAPPALPRPGRVRPAGLPRPRAGRRATPDRCRSRSSTTCSGSPTRAAPRSTRCARCWRCRRPPSARLADRTRRAAGGRRTAADPAAGRVRVRRARRRRRRRRWPRRSAALGFAHDRAAPHRSRCSCGSRAAPGCCSTRRRRGRAPDRRRGGRARRRDRRPARGGRSRAEALLAPVLPRRRGPAEADLSAVAAPDGTAVFFCRTGAGDADQLAGRLRPDRRGRRPAPAPGSPTSTTSR